MKSLHHGKVGCSVARVRGNRCIAACLAALGLVGVARASEGGNNNSTNGNTDVLAGVALPPKPGGFLAVLPVAHYGSTQINDGNGQAWTPPAFRLGANVVGAALIYNTGAEFLGASVGASGGIGYARLSLEGLGPSKQTAEGATDLTLTPVILNWNPGRLHVATALELSLPAGSYDEHRLVNPGFGYTTWRPVLAVSYLSAGGFEASARSGVDFNMENGHTHYRSGRAFHADYNLGQQLGDWKVGVSGYLFRQWQDDRLNGESVGPDGNRGRAFSIGPVVGYNTPSFGVVAKYQRESAVRNRAQGEQFVLDFSFHF